MRRITILQGEHAVSGEPGVVMSTLLGSCIAVCLHDPVARVGGMNHFLLGGGSGGDQPRPADDLHRYGMHAMEVLINALMQHGGVRARLKAHCYGGADIVRRFGTIGTENAAFIRRFLAAEAIPAVHQDLGGHGARRVEFLPHAGKSRCSRSVEAPAPTPIGRSPVHAAVAGEVELF